MPFPLSLPLSPSSSSWSICVAGCLWRNEGLQSAITNVCCPVSRHLGGFQLNFDFTCQNMSTCMRVVCCKSSCFTESLHTQKFGCGALCRCCIIGYISFEYGHNTGVYLGICYNVCITWKTMSLGAKIFNGMEQFQNKKIAGDIDMGIFAREFS